MRNMPKIYCADNVQRAKYAQIGVLVLALVVSGYLGGKTVSSVRQVWKSRKMLSAAQREAVALSKTAAQLQKEFGRDGNRPLFHNGGVDVFALQMSRWAADQKINVESVTPQGVPTSSDISVDDIKIGAWDAVKVRVEGRGDYFQVLRLLNQFRNPGMPVKLESFAFQSEISGGPDEVRFDLMLTVYERKAKSG